MLLVPVAAWAASVVGTSVLAAAGWGGPHARNRIRAGARAGTGRERSIWSVFPKKLLDRVPTAARGADWCQGQRIGGESDGRVDHGYDDDDFVAPGDGRQRGGCCGGPCVVLALQMEVQRKNPSLSGCHEGWMARYGDDNDAIQRAAPGGFAWLSPGPPRSLFGGGVAR